MEPKIILDGWFKRPDIGGTNATLMIGGEMDAKNRKGGDESNFSMSSP